MANSLRAFVLAIWTFAPIVLHASACRGADEPVLAVFQDIDGRRFDVAGERGHWVLINYFATWCSPCTAEIPELSALYAENHGRLVIVAVTDETLPRDTFRAFIANHSAPYPRLDVAAGSLPPSLPGRVLGLQMRPITYLIRPDGSVAQHFVGDMDPAAIAFVRRAVAAKPPISSK